MTTFQLIALTEQMPSLLITAAWFAVLALMFAPSDFLDR